MRWIIESSLKLRFLLIIIAAAIMFIGVTQLRDMPVDVLPELAPPYVEVHTEALGLSAEEVEQLITVPLEQDLLNGVPWLEEIRSESIPGLSSVVMIFEPGTDIMRARQVVQERLTQSHQLPAVSKRPEMIQPLSTTSRVMMIGLTSEQLSDIQMSVLSRWIIRPRLLGVPGVANVVVWGQRERQLQVRVEPERLNEQGVTLTEVIEAAGNSLWMSPLTFLDASIPGTGGFIDTANQRLEVRHVLPITTADTLAKVSFTGSDGKIKLLDDVAEVVEDHQPLIGDAIVDGEPGLLLIVEKFPSANTLEVTRGVEEALNELQPGLAGLEMDTTAFRPATFIESSIDNLTRALIIGSVLLVVVLVAFLYSWRSALISAVAIPLSLITAALVLFLLGISMNTMVLAGLALALGVIVDDAIIDAHNIRQRLRQRLQGGSSESPAAIILEASQEVRSAIIYATLILALVIVPLFFIGGLFGALLKPLAVSYLVAMAASMVVALTVTPALALILFSEGSPGRRESPLVRWLRRGYEAALAWTVRTPRWAYAAFGIIVVLSLVTVPWLGLSTLPSFKENDLLVRWEGMPGTSHPEMARITTRAVHELKSIPQVRNVNAHVGRAIMSDQVSNVESGQIWVSLDPRADYDASVAAVERVVGGYPGLSTEVQTYLKEVVGEVPRIEDSIIVRIYGQDLGILRSKAEELRQGLAGIEGIVDSRVETLVEKPQLRIQVDLGAAQEHGIKPGDVRRAAATLLQGIQVGALFEEQKVFEVVVWSVPETRHSLSDVRQLLVDLPIGGREGVLRLGEVADVRIVPSPDVIKHEAVSRYIDVGVNVQGRNINSVARDIEQAIQGLALPLEYHAEVKRAALAQGQALQGPAFIGLAVAVAIGVFLLLQAALGNWRVAAMAFVTLPLALAGGLLAMFLNGGVIALGSLLGFLVVFGIAVRNGIMLIRHYQYLEREEGEPFGSGLILRGTRERFAPILLTSVATMLAVLPLVVLGNVPGYETLHPMAVFILGGAVTAALLNLFIIPLLYLRFGSGSGPDRDTLVDLNPRAQGVS
jgi:CzcA family heavy metal efflux pump